MRNQKQIEMIRNENAGFYQNDDLLKSKAYVKELGWLNCFLGLVYIFVSFGFATLVKNSFRTYQYVLQAGYEDLGSMEVLEWASRQAHSRFWDGTQITIAVISFMMLLLVARVSFVVKKYDLYKHQGRYLFELVALAVMQTLCAVIIPCWGVEVSRPLVGAAVISWLFQVAVLLPQIFGGEMFYPLEFKNLSQVMKVFNLLTKFFLKQWLDDKNQ